MISSIFTLGLLTVARAYEESSNGGWIPIDPPVRPQRSLGPLHQDPIDVNNDINSINPINSYNSFVQLQPQGQIPTTFNERIVPIIIQRAIPIPVRTPIQVPVQVPVQIPSPVPVEVQVPVPVVRTLTVPVDKPVPVEVIKEIPVPVVRDVEVPVAKPYPVPVPIYKTKVIDHGTRHRYEDPHHGWW